MEIDGVFLQGVAATVSALIVFIGSVWLLLTVIMGARLAYFVTASVAIGFIFIMTLVWSYGDPLGPVGQLPVWNGVEVKESASQLEFGSGSEYPQGRWHEPNPDDPEETAFGSELESAASDYLERQLRQDAQVPFLSASDATPDSESVRLLEQGDTRFGAVTLEASDTAVRRAEEADPDQNVTSPDATVVVVMEHDPGDPSGKARVIALGTFVVFALHLFGLSRTEKRARREAEAGGNGS